MTRVGSQRHSKKKEKKEKYRDARLTAYKTDDV